MAQKWPESIKQPLLDFCMFISSSKGCGVVPFTGNVFHSFSISINLVMTQRTTPIGTGPGSQKQKPRNSNYSTWSRCNALHETCFKTWNCDDIASESPDLHNSMLSMIEVNTNSQLDRLLLHGVWIWTSDSLAADTTWLSLQRSLHWVMMRICVWKGQGS